MFTWFKRHFIPHTGNDHRPYLLQGESARTTVVMILLFELFVFLLPTFSLHQNAQNDVAAVLPVVLATLANEERTQEKLPELAISPVLTRAAELKAQDMATKGYFAHTSPEGKTPWHWLKTAGYNYQYAGENLAINFTDSKDVTAAWMNSPGHKANIVKGVYTEVGTGVATGMYEGRETVFVAQVYASPQSTPVVPRMVAQAPVEAVSVEETSIEAIEPTQSVLGVEAPVIESTVVPEVTVVDRAVASPAHTANAILIIIGGIVALVVVLTIVIKINTQHPDLITNGMAVIAVVGGIVLGNTFLSTASIKTSVTEYSFVPEIITNRW